MYESSSYTFTYGCMCGDLELVKLAYSFGDVNVRDNDDYAIKISCKKQLKHIAEWLIKICDVYRLIIYYDGTFGYSIIDPLDDYLRGDLTIDNIKNKYKLENICLTECECIICYSVGEIVSRCNHQYCLECFLKIKSQNNVCAYCRTNLGMLKDSLEKIIEKY